MNAFRLTAAVVALGAGAALFGPMAAASADTVPGCTAADITAVETGVAARMTGFLVSRPDVNDFFSGLQGSSKQDAYNQAQAYLNANPDVKAQVDDIRAPVLDLRNRCGIPLTAIVRGVL